MRHNAAMNFMQTTGSARNQALSEGASGTEANLYALTNGVADALISKYGVGAAQKGIESLPENLQNAWKKVSNTVKSADAAMQEILEEQMSDATQRAARGIYDEDAKLFSLSDENAVFNPKSMLESALMGSISPLVMGEIDAIRTKGTPEPARVKVDNEVETHPSSKKVGKENNGKKKKYGNKNTKDKQTMEQESLVQYVRNGDISKINNISASAMRNPEVQKLVSKESGVTISPFDNPKKDDLRQKYKLAAVEMGRKKTKEKGLSNDSGSALEKEEDKTYNKNNKRK